MEDHLSQIKLIEKNIENHLESLELDSNGPESSDQINTLNKSLEKLKLSIDQLKSSAATKHEMAYVSQYSTSYNRLKQRFIRIKNSVESLKWKEELIGNENHTDTTQIDILLTEGRNLDNSLSIGKSVISSANEVLSSLGHQKEKILKTSDKIVKFAETLPGINTVLSKISRRKRFNALVIGIALFICFTLTLIYLV